MPDLVRLRFVLEKLLRQKIENCRNQAYKHSIQDVLFKTPEAARITPEATIVFKEGRYPAKDFYRGSFKFDKHFFPHIGAMNDEEIECAKALEMNAGVKTWVRNLERQPEYSFWLPTHQDRFYPDFIAELNDGRILVVEYKGEHLVSSEDSQEKELIGHLWADRSGGKCLFLMATKQDYMGLDIYSQITKVIK